MHIKHALLGLALAAVCSTSALAGSVQNLPLGGFMPDVGVLPDTAYTEMVDVSNLDAACPMGTVVQLHEDEASYPGVNIIDIPADHLVDAATLANVDAAHVTAAAAVEYQGTLWLAVEVDGCLLDPIQLGYITGSAADPAKVHI